MAADFTSSIAQLGQLRLALQSALFGEVTDEMQSILVVARDTYTPIDTGLLRSTGRVEGPTTSGSGIEAAISFGSSEAFYSALVHEDLSKHHNPPTQAKYLQHAVDDHTPTMPGRMATAISAAMRGAI